MSGKGAMAAPTPVTMGNGSGSASRPAVPLGQHSSDYKGCWKQCGGCCWAYIMPCGEKCFCAFLCMCPIPFPACDCYCQKDDNPSEWKEPCDGDGNSNVMFLKDEATIGTRNEGICGTCECCEWRKV
mmetsp:Transcript_440/g.1179  ORF Transcript_440/g.1179 Transcript_440/m.1179 type:complete len:127 (-) Transcript_440:282-662(-)